MEDKTPDKLDAVIAMTRTICYALLNKTDGLKIDAKKADNNGVLMLVINLYLENPRDVGILLGKKTHTPRMKDCISKILQQVAFYAGVNRLELIIDDISKLPKD